MRPAAAFRHLLAVVLSGLAALPLPAQPSSFPDRALLDANNMATWLSVDGSFAWREPSSGANVVFPRKTAGAVFTQGFLWGGIRVLPDGSRRVLVNGNAYDVGLTPGSVVRSAETGAVSGIGDSTDAAAYHVWRVHRGWNTMDFREAAAAYFGVALRAVTGVQREQIRAWYAYDWERWPAERGAPYEERNGVPGYQPPLSDAGTGEWVGDLPGYPGADQTLWTVSHDFTASRQALGSEPFGMEYQVTLWAYDQPTTTALGNTHFARHRLIYTGLPNTPEGTRIDSMFVSKFADPDLGDYADDFAGSDSLRDLGFAYNAGATDSEYQRFGLAPPAIGWTLLQGPVTAEGERLGMTAFWHSGMEPGPYEPDEEYFSERPLHWFNRMRGFAGRPAYPAAIPFRNPLTNQPEPILVAGDPVTGQGWIDGLGIPPGDRRFAISSGPFSMSLGDTMDVVYAQIGGAGAGNLSPITVLKHYADVVRFMVNVATDAEEPDEPAAAFRLRGNAPNPFGASTLISFDLPAAAEVSVAVYDVLGRQVADVPARSFAPGPAQSVRLDASGLPSGVYVYRVRAEQAGRVEVLTGRMVVAR